MKTRTTKIVLCVLFLGLLLVGAVLGGIKWNIRQAVQDNCQLAQQAHPHPGDDVGALVDFMKSDSHTVYDRTHKGVWTLGQLRDPKALPHLEAAYTGQSCDHENSLCQHELEKAIKLCGGTPNQPRATNQ